ncbi:uncharacterized protein LOC131937710 [Physella acuta]|uniref:uncharacterized protein LOC131937710 n=1 Tax=Physella acuta TaxID=109671 RepID=UPI0027DCEF75|nr:uncharacterized protein LOC131937710 [Physella acuta]XP_059151296.1 uncharacterized protein LOC131937710 [Physella acuta]XP_059151297.1 uncharacterized protein LOC131937710 [Physella acuta]
MIQMYSSAESSKAMRNARPWYLLPFLVNLALVFSATHLVNIIDQNVMEETLFSLPSWILYATIAVVTPTSLAGSRLLPDPSVALFIGSLISSAGLLWTGLENGTMQMISFGVITGAGLSFSLQALCMAISPYFIRDGSWGSVVTLMLSTVLMVGLYPLMAFATKMASNNIFLYLSPVVVVSSLPPFLMFLRSQCLETGDKKDTDVMQDSDDELLIPDLEMASDTKGPVGDNVCKGLRHGFKIFCSEDGWGASIISVFVWLSWGASIDTTWLLLGWRFQYFETTTGLAALQLFLCLVLLAFKIGTEMTRQGTSHSQPNLASNYMHLGLLGVGGIILYLFPDHSHPFHNHLLFTVGLALQYDDLSDLYMIPNSSLALPTNQFQLVKYKITLLTKEGGTKYNPVWGICCLVCHMLSLLLMSCLAMILGVQLANIIGYLSTFCPLTYLFSRGGLLVMSLAAIVVSYMRIDTWLGRKHPLYIV